MINKKALLGSLFGLVLLAGCNSGGIDADDMKTDDVTKEEGVQLPDTIKIGFIAPLTGNAAYFGQDIKSSVSLYFSENPTISGKSVEVIYEDGKCNGQDAANAAQKLINIDKVQVIIGGACSGETLAAAPIAEQAKVLLLSPGSSSPAVTDAGDYVFRNYPSDDQVAKTLVNDVLKNHKIVALLTEQTDYAQGYRGAIQKHMKEAGQTLVLDEAFAADNSDFRTLLTKVKEAEADALIFVGQAAVTSGFAMKQTRELGLDIQVYGTDSMPGPDFFATAKDAAEGAKAVYATSDPSRSGYSELKAKLPAPQSFEFIQMAGYDASSILVNAIKEVGYDGTAIKDYFYNMPTFKGVASDVTFDKNGDNNVDAAVSVAKGGEFVLVK